MPLIESAGTSLTVLGRDVWWEMKVNVIDAFHFEAGWKRIVASRDLASAQDVHLRLDRYRRTVWQAIYVDSIVRGQIWVRAVCEATGLLVRIKAGNVSSFLERARLAHLP